MTNHEIGQSDTTRDKENPMLPTSHECARLPGLKAEERRLAALHAAWTMQLEEKQAEARRIGAEPPSPDRDRRHEAVLLEIEGINQKRTDAGNRQKEIIDEIQELGPACRGVA
ncbi:MAG: hypothetical protein ACREB6_11985 [Rhodospirillales bacterium]